ncbi:MAG: flagellar hook protein FlgE [Giesbergeria sp.]|uniref:flagellar hook protein FlgE n=1 Tax=Giesbergeria sp. TaxID=2818473 RepID=UPI0026020FD4|nr:flagellar hook protein FlgE [Giesbergeria sp.]MDD2608309.1 flagellar hook protein FlgE [Giesbergeria sp.]
MGFQHGLSGLNAAKQNLDVIGHNIANANTTGFKGSRAEFAAIIAGAMGVSNSGNADGVQTAVVAQQFRAGAITRTGNNSGNNFDLAISGNGFFIVRQADGTNAYTRAGDFKLYDGNLMTNDRSHVMGYKINPDGTGTNVPEPLVFPVGTAIPAKSTTEITAAFNLDARATNAAGTPAIPADPAAVPPTAAVPAVPPTPRNTYGTSVEVYDSQGVATPLDLYFEKTATPNTWNVYTSLDAGAPIATTISFDAEGKIITDPATPITISVTPTSNPNTGAPAPFNVTLDLSKVTQYGNEFAISDLKQDGYAAGLLLGVSVDNLGQVQASYSNGIKRVEGQVALATFRNVQGLAPIGGNAWVETGVSGEPMFGKPNTGNFGSIDAGALEESNVDLTGELVNMMTAQRAYQANAQTIKTQDQAMSTIVNLR